MPIAVEEQLACVGAQSFVEQQALEQPDKAARAREMAEQWKAIAEKLSTSDEWSGNALD